MTEEITALDLIIALRGGLPEKCDFCDQPYTNERQPVPEEAGEWACTECYARWDMERKQPEQPDEDPS